MRVLRHKLPITAGPIHVEMDQTGQRLDVLMKPGEDVISLYELDRGGPRVQRTYFIAGTGHPVPDIDCVYIGSVVHGAAASTFVWHLFERRAGDAP